MNGPSNFRSPLLLCVGALLLACSGEEEPGDEAARVIRPKTDLVGIEMIDDERAIVVGLTGEIHVTSDAGLSWRRSHVPADLSLHAISMADAGRGWSVGDGVILRTDDGGNRWRRQGLPGRAASIRLSSVRAIDEMSAIAVGENGLLLRTRDGGGVWEPISPSSISDFEAFGAYAYRDVFCSGDSHDRCWTVGRGLRRTDDGGDTWRRIDLEDHPAIEPIRFGLRQVELASVDEERLRSFVSSIRHRFDLHWLIEPRIGQHELESIGRRRDPTALFELIGARVQEVRTLIEEARIAPERIVAMGTPPWDYQDYLDDDPEFLERYWHERSARQSEIRIRILDERLLRSLRVDDAGLGLAVGESGTLLRSGDGGDHWQNLERPTPHDLHAVGLGGRRAVVVGANGGLWISKDEGESWRSAIPDADQGDLDALHAISFSPSRRIGIVVGEHGRILRSVDGGETWLELDSGFL